MADNLRDKITRDIEEKEQKVRDREQNDDLKVDPESFEKKTAVKGEKSWKTMAFGNVNLEDIANFSRELSIMLDVGIPLLKSLEIITRRTRKPKMKKALDNVVLKVSEGNPLSSACSEHPEIFPPLFINVVKVGEAGGILDHSLKRLEVIFMKQLSIRRKVRGAMMYPVIALSLALIVLMVIFILVVPQFQTLYQANEVALPAITSFTLAIGNFLGNWWGLVIVIIIGCIIGFKVLMKSPPFRKFMDIIRLKIPFIGKVYRDIIISHISRTFESLMKSGIPLLDSLKILKDTSPNYCYSRDLDKVASTVEQGGKMAQSLDNSLLFPPVVVDMLSIGEETGSIETVLTKLSEYYEDKVDTQLAALSSIIEPLLIIIIGGIVLFVAVSFLLPYWNLVNVIV